MRNIFMPSSLEELFSVMSENPDTSVMAGGTDLVVRLRNASNDRKKLPVALLEKISCLKEIKIENNRLCIGSGATFSEIIENREVNEHAPLLVQASSVIGGPAIRNMATIGGNIVTASPAGDSLPPLYLMNAELEIVSVDNTKTVGIADFIKGPSKTVLKHGEILKSIIIQLKTPKCNDNDPLKNNASIKNNELLKSNNSLKYMESFEKIGRRKALAVAVASFAGFISVDENGMVNDAGFAWGSVAPAVFRSDEAERIIKGSYLEPEAVAEAAARVAESVSPIDDIRATASYRKKAAGNLLVRFLEESRMAR